MAPKERLPQNARPENKRQYSDGESLDVALLCAKLEAAKREREERNAASRARRQHAWNNARRDSNASRENDDRPRLPKSNSDDHASKRRSWYGLPRLPFQHQPASYSLTNLNIPEEQQHSTCDDLISPILDNENREIAALSGDSTPDEAAIQRRRRTKKKRNSFLMLNPFTSNERPQPQHLPKERPTSANQKRSQTLPLFKSKYFSPKPNLHDDAPKDSCHPSDEDDFGGLVNEYTVSFDTCHVKETIRHQAVTKSPAADRPRLGQGEGMRSLLNLSSVLKRDKKDRVQAQVEEIPAPLNQDDEEEDEADPATRQPHARSHTAPEELLCDAVARMEKEKVKKRITLGGFFQGLLLPNHSMSMHQVTL